MILEAAYLERYGKTYNIFCCKFDRNGLLAVKDIGEHDKGWLLINLLTRHCMYFKTLMYSILQKLGILTPGTSIGLQLQLLPLATGLQVFFQTFCKRCALCHLSSLTPCCFCSIMYRYVVHIHLEFILKLCRSARFNLYWGNYALGTSPFRNEKPIPSYKCVYINDLY